MDQPLLLAAETSNTPAIVAAIAAVTAAVIAALSSIGRDTYNSHLQRRGVATILGEDLHRWEAHIVEAFYRGYWWGEGELLPGQATTDDLKLAATTLGPREWWTLSSARRWVQFLEAVRSGAVTQDVGDDSKARALSRPKVNPEQRRWLGETFYRLEAARWGLYRQALSLRDRRRRVELWRPYRQENLRRRYAPRLSDPKALTTLDGDRAADLQALLRGVSEHLEGAGKRLMPKPL